MNWIIKHEPKKLDQPWSVYSIWNKREVYETGFPSEAEAKVWMDEAFAHPEKHVKPVTQAKDEVNVASDQSFPASDPPAWNETTAL